MEAMDTRAINIYRESAEAFYRFFTYLPENLSEMNENSDPDWNCTDELIEHGCTMKEIEKIDAYYKETLSGIIEDDLYEMELANA
jgi:hypothetical protein